MPAKVEQASLPALEVRRAAVAPLTEEQRVWLVSNFKLKPASLGSLDLRTFGPWRSGEVPISLLLQLDPSIGKIGKEDPEVQRRTSEARRDPLARVVLLQDPDGSLFVLFGRHLVKAHRDVYGGRHSVEVLLGANRSEHPTVELYWARRIWHVNEILLALEKRIRDFSGDLDEEQKGELAGLKTAMTKDVHFDIRNGKVHAPLANLLLTSLSREMDRLLRIGLPFTQQLCGSLAQGYEEIGEIFDDLNLIASDPNRQRLALLGYELANLWYRAAQHVYTGIFPVKAQLRIVNNMIRLGTLATDRGILRRAIRELCVLLDTHRFTEEYLRLVSQWDASEPLSPGEEEDLIVGLLDTRRRFRSEVREAMSVAVRRFHSLMPDAVKTAYRSLEADILSGRAGPGSLLRFLGSNLTVIQELEYVEGGRDFTMREGTRPRYMNMLEHVEEVTKGLQALETAARGVRALSASRALPSGDRDERRKSLETRGSALVRQGIAYFYGRLRATDRERTDFDAFVELFRDVVQDYERFTSERPISKLNFWLGTILHDLGSILLEQHHVGGARLADSLLEALEMSPGRRESILSYIQNHGEFKRFYLLEKSPKALLSFIHDREKRGAVPPMLLERRRIESIIDMAATGEGLLTTRFLEVSRRNKSIPAMERVAADLGSLRKSVWGLAGTENLYAQQVLPDEREDFFDAYFDEMHIVYYHNLRKALSPQALLNFHYVCARTARMTGLPIQTVRLSSDRPEHLQALNRTLGYTDVKELRELLSRIWDAVQELPEETRVTRLLREVRARSGLILELKSGHTLSANTKLIYEVTQRRPGPGEIGRPTH